MKKRGRKAGHRKQPKKGLTPTEALVVKLMLDDMKKRWADLLARNKWRAGK